VPVFADVVLHPTFPEAELKIVQPKMLANVARAEGDWHGLLTKRFRHDFFPGSPLALLPSGSEAVLNAATAKSVADYHKDTIKAGDSVLAIYGRFDKDRMEQQVRKLFAAMPEGVNKLPVVAPRQVAPGGEVFDEKGRTAGAGVIVAAPGMKLTDKPDSLAMTVLKTIISGYQLPSGWLHNELRGQKLVYVVHALNWEALVPGAFYSYAQCEPANVEKVAQIIRDNFRKTTTYAFTQEEVDDAVNTVLTADLLGKQEMLDLATQAALNELYGFGYDYSAKLEKLLRAVTPADVSAVAKKYLSGGYVTVIVTPEGEPAGSVEPPAPEQE
jgi:zinc protease